MLICTKKIVNNPLTLNYKFIHSCEMNEQMRWPSLIKKKTRKEDRSLKYQVDVLT